MRKCRKCDVELVKDENWTKSRYSRNQYICKVCRYEYNKLNNLKVYSKYPPGIYCFKNKKGEIVYIGESVRPAKRKERHLYDKGTKIPKECKWDMLEYIDDEHQRRIREFELIYEHKPIYNKPYRKF